MAYKSLDSITRIDIESLGIAAEDAARLHASLTEIIGIHGTGTPATWDYITKRILNPQLPFSFHQMLYYGCYKDYGPDPPAWLPDPGNAILTNVGQLLERRGKEFLGSAYKDPITSFSDFQKFSVSNPEEYWKTVLDEMNISFSKQPECILQENLPGESQLSNPGGQWLPGASLNPAKNCLNLNGKRSLNDTMIIWRDEVHNDLPVHRMTLEELREEVWLVAYALQALGLEEGSAIAIDMPMNVKSVVIYLAIVLAGYVVVSIADSFAAPEISTRLKISKAKVIFTQDLIIRGDKSLPLYSRVVDAQSPMAVVIPTRGSGFSMKLRSGDLSWHDFLEGVNNLKGKDAASLTVDKDNDKAANNKDMASAAINTGVAPAVENDTVKTNAPQAIDSDKGDAKCVDAEDNSEKKEKNEEEMPTLDKIGTNLTKLAQEGKLDPFDGREELVERVLRILCRRTKCNPCLIGTPGFGKTAIVEALAQRIQSGTVPEKLKEKKVTSITLHNPESRAYWPVMLGEKITKEIEQSRDMIVFFDEVYSFSLVRLLRPALERGDIQCIAATRTLDEYTDNSLLEGVFQPVLQVPETSIDDTIKILKRFRGLYETHHKVQYTDEAFVAAVKLSSRYLSDGVLLDKAIDVIDEAGSRVQVLQAKEPNLLLHSNKRMKTETDTDHNNDDTPIMVTKEDVQHIVSSHIGIPVHEVSKEESERLLKLEETLHESIIGQHEALVAIGDAIRRARVGLKSTKRPIASFIFTGPTGVGKTEVAKALASQYFGSEDSMVRFDMSEYMEKHEVSKLIGSPPGYSMCDEGGQLTEAVRRKPHTVVLFDEIEKAHPDVMHIMLQVLEDGRLTDNKGETVNFSNTIIIMTSNVGGEIINRESSSWVSKGKINNLVMKEIGKNFRPEFLNRFDEIIIFKHLTKGEVYQIADLMFKAVGDKLKAKDIKLSVSDKFRERVVNDGYSPCHGARQLRRVITKLLENILANKLLSKEIKEGDSVLVDVDSEGNIQVLHVPSFVWAE